MKIINRAAFLQMPAGTVFAKYQPCCFEDVCIKGNSTGFNDFFYQAIKDAIDCSGTDEFVELLDKAEKDGISLKLDLDSEGRDGLFDDDQLFAVWERADVEQLIKRLQATLANVSEAAA